MYGKSSRGGSGGECTTLVLLSLAPAGGLGRLPRYFVTGKRKFLYETLTFQFPWKSSIYYSSSPLQKKCLEQENTFFRALLFAWCLSLSKKAPARASTGSRS